MYRINTARCSVCGLCADVCPTDAISQYGEYKITPALCTSCGQCMACCPSGAVDIVEGAQEGRSAAPD